MKRVVVVGATPAALGAAAYFARLGHEVRYLGTAPLPARWIRVVAVPRALDEALALLWPGARELAVRREVLVASRRRPLPLRRRHTPPSAWIAALRARSDTYAGWLRARGVAEIAAPWAEKRLAGSIEGLSPAMSWMHRGGGRYLTGWSAAADVDAVLEAGGEVLDGVVVERFDIERGRVVAVETDHGREHVEGPLLVDASPGPLSGWAGLGAPAGLRSVDAVQVSVEAEGELPDALAVPEPTRPFWALTREGAVVTAHASGDVSAGAVIAGLSGLAKARGAPAVARIEGGVPVLSVDNGLAGWHEALWRLGVSPIGRAVGRPLSFADELAWLVAIGGARRPVLGHAPPGGRVDLPL